jgi:hypothetical protein
MLDELRLQFFSSSNLLSEMTGGANAARFISLIAPSLFHDPVEPNL